MTLPATPSTRLRGFHFRFGEHGDVAILKRVITEGLAPLGVNTLLLECNTSFQFESHPEVSGGTLTPDDARDLAAHCRAHGVRLIPLFECLGHQGWGGAPNSLLRAHPEFDETPGVPESAKWPDIYCRSWCPLHPDIWPLAFDLLDDLLEAFGADALHVGLDEVFTLADDNCPRCRGRDRAELFADATRKLREHLVGRRGVQMLMWADRLVDARSLGYSEWEGDVYGTHRALDGIPTDIILCDWHYDPLPAYPSIDLFLERGFTVWPSVWRSPAGALSFLSYAERVAAEQGAAARLPGMLVTGWNATAPRLQAALLGEGDLGADEGGVGEIAETLRTVMKTLAETDRR